MAPALTLVSPLGFLASIYGSSSIIENILLAATFAFE
jgi:hypothetical protein